jgi:hypothetical protein
LTKKIAQSRVDRIEFEVIQSLRSLPVAMKKELGLRKRKRRMKKDSRAPARRRGVGEECCLRRRLQERTRFVALKRLQPPVRLSQDRRGEKDSTVPARTPHSCGVESV